MERRISELKIIEVEYLNSPDRGYYIGREEYDRARNEWLQVSKVSSMVDDKDTARDLLKKVLAFKNDLKDISDGNLKVLAKAFHEAIKDDPDNELKRNVVLDMIKNERSLTKEVELER